MAKDWLKESLKESRKMLKELPEWKKRALEYDAKFRELVKK